MSEDLKEDLFLEILARGTVDLIKEETGGDPELTRAALRELAAELQADAL